MIRLWIYRAATIGAVILLAIPNAVGLGSSGAAWRTALVPLWLTSALCLPEAARRIPDLVRWVRQPRNWVLTAFLLVLLGGFLHGAVVSAAIPLASAIGLLMIWGTITLFAALGRLAWPNRSGEFVVLAGVSLVLFVGVNLAMAAAGMGEKGGGLWILGLVGVHGKRLTLPMMQGPNSGGSVAGAAMAASFLALSTVTRKHRLIALIALLGGMLSLAGVLLTDSRGGFLLGLAAIGLVLALPSRRLSVVRWLCLAPAFVPLINWLVQDVAGGPGLTRLLSPLDRGGSFASRIETWRAALTELAHPRWIHWIGYGYKGDVTSGVAARAASAIDLTRTPILGPHNAVLQYILDNGYIGAALFLAVMFLSIRRLAQMAADNPTSGARPALGVMVYLALLGTIERVPTVYSQELFTVFLFIVIFTLFAPHGENVPAASPAAAPAEESAMDGGAA